MVGRTKETPFGSDEEILGREEKWKKKEEVNCCTWSKDGQIREKKKRT